jgi:hypothetical protein
MACLSEKDNVKSAVVCRAPFVCFYSVVAAVAAAALALFFCLSGLGGFRLIAGFHVLFVCGEGTVSTV